MTFTRRALLGTLLPAAAFPVVAQEPQAPRKYAAMSVLADRLTLVFYVMGVGSTLDRNQHEDVPLASTELDDVVLMAISQGLAKVSARDPVFYRSSSPSMFAAAERIPDATPVVFPPVLASAFARDAVTHLILVTKYRGATSLKFRNSHTGTGQLEGMGFYIDRVLPTIRTDTQERGTGFIAPYAYFKVSVIDVAARSVVRSEAVTASTTRSSARNIEGADAWGAMTAAEKLSSLRDLLTSEVSRATASLAAS